MKFCESRRLQARSHAAIPGGAHTYSKGDDQYPEASPVFIDRGKGCHVWDVDGNEFIEYGMGLRAVTLGHAFEPVVKAAYEQMQLGANFTRPAKIEVEAAEAFLQTIDGADMVKFAKNGSDVTTAAVKLARAYTGRDLVAICGDQPFFSTDDWFIGTTEMNAGIPKAIVDMTLKFRYNDLGNLRAVVRPTSRTDRLCLDGSGSDYSSRAGLSDGGENTLRRARHGPRFRRDDYGISLASGRGPEVSRRRSSFVHLRQSDGKWVCHLGASRQT